MFSCAVHKIWANILIPAPMFSPKPRNWLAGAGLRIPAPSPSAPAGPNIRKEITMAKKTETALTPREAIRKGWLAYLGVYGAAYDRAEAILTGKGAEIFEEFVEKGEAVENRAQDAFADVRERAHEMYGDRLNFDRFRRFFPQNKASKGRVEELEAEVAALNKKLTALTKKKTAKRSAKKAAKKAA